MTVPSVLLTGDALTGVHADGEPYRRAVAALPQTVRLGRVRSRRLRTPLHLADFVDFAAADPPPSKDWYTKAALSIARMYLNDRLGDCVVAGKAHAFGVWSANDPDSGGTIVGTDAEISSQYRQWCGHLGNDSGCVIDEVLNAILRTGMVLGGKTYRIDGFCGVDWTNKKLAQVALLLTGATTIGINLPEAWTNSSIWDVTNSRIVGGHDVTPCGYDEKGVYVSSWGRIYLITWAAFLQTRWVEEMWVMLSDTWYGPDKVSPAGLNAERLKEKFDTFKQGGVPDWEPVPVPPPLPPVPPQPPEPPVPQTFPNYEGIVALPFGLSLPFVAIPDVPAHVGAASFDPVAVIQDLFAIYTAYQTGSIPAVEAAVKQLLADLGLSPFGAAGAGFRPDWIQLAQLILNALLAFLGGR